MAELPYKEFMGAIPFCCEICGNVIYQKVIIINSSTAYCCGLIGQLSHRPQIMSIWNDLKQSYSAETLET